MFLSAVIPLRATSTLHDDVPFLGREVHAWMLNEVARADPALASSLHDPQQYERPFTVSGLLGNEGTRGIVHPKVIAGCSYTVRWTSLGADLSALLLERALPRLPATARLGAAHFEVGDPLTDRSDHPLARQSSATALMEHWFGSDTRLPRLIRLEYRSPTAVRHIHRNLVVPEPAAVFASWLRAWNLFGAPAFDTDFVDFVEAQVLISRYNLRSVRVQIGKGTQLGCVGWCNYYVFQRELAARRILHLLADFAEFCGTGYKTTQGLGQTRYVRPRENAE